MKNPNKTKTLLSIVLSTGFLSQTLSCGTKKGEEGKNNNASSDNELPYGKLVLSSDALAGIRLNQAASQCTMYGDQIAPSNGACITPLAVGGYAGRVTFGAKDRDPHLRGNARMFSADERTVEPGQLFSGGVFDIANPSQSLVGNNTLAGPTSDRTVSHRTEPQMLWTHAIVELGYLKYQVYLKGSYVTVLLPSHAQPYADDESLSQCETRPSDIVLGQSRYTNATLIDKMTFRNGDYLFCVKDTAAAVCEPTDYKWLDLNALTLVSTRPNNPRQATALKDPPSCTISKGPALLDKGSDEGRFELGYGVVKLMAKFKSGKSFKLYGEYTHGPLSEQWKDETAPFGKDKEEKYQFKAPWVYYTYTPSAGDIQNGGNLTVDLDFDVNGMVFLAMDVDDMESSTLEQHLKVIDTRSTWINDQIAANKLPSAGLLENLPIMEVTPHVSVTGDLELPTAFEELFSTSGQIDHNADE